MVQILGKDGSTSTKKLIQIWEKLQMLRVQQQKVPWTLIGGCGVLRVRVPSFSIRSQPMSKIA